MVKWSRSQTYKDINKKKRSEERDVMTQLFELHVEHILIKVSLSIPVWPPSDPGVQVFLSLDPRSLAQAQQVCRAWREFIKQQLWASKLIRWEVRGVTEDDMGLTFPMFLFVSLGVIWMDFVKRNLLINLKVINHIHSFYLLYRRKFYKPFIFLVQWLDFMLHNNYHIS